MSVLNLVEILKGCPKGTKFYSPLYGDIFFSHIAEDYYAKPVRFFSALSVEEAFYSNGKKEDCYPDAEIMVFPSKYNRDWRTFKVEKPKFDVSSLQPFDKVLVRDGADDDWQADFFSHISDFQSIHSNEVQNRFFCVSGHWGQCVPYNDDTKRLIGTSNSAPEFYVTWEE